MRRAGLLGLLFIAGCGAAPASTDQAPLRLSGAEIRIELAPGLEAQRADIRKWVADGVQALNGYYGRMPVDALTVMVDRADAVGVRGGKSFGYPAPLIRMAVGSGTSPAQFRDDWMMTHELVHLAFPSLPDAQLWAQEGLATYVEPLARHQAGQLGAHKVWRDLMDGIPKGTQALAGAGLDEDGSWASTYWGGAYFWLRADLEIRAQSGGRMSLRDALRAILAAGGTSAAVWSMRDTLRIGDQAVGAPVLEALYDRLRGRAQHVDIAALWRDLGVSPDGASGVRYNDDAPLARWRRAIAQ